LLPKETDVPFKSKWRAVIDFRKLSEWAVGYAYPVPSINDISDHLGKATQILGYGKYEPPKKNYR